MTAFRPFPLATVVPESFRFLVEAVVAFLPSPSSLHHAIDVLEVTISVFPIRLATNILMFKYRGSTLVVFRTFSFLNFMIISLCKLYTLLSFFVAPFYCNA